MQFIAQQAAEKLVWPVIPRSRRRRGISHWLENNQSEIPRSARNDSLEGFFRSLSSRELLRSHRSFRDGTVHLRPARGDAVKLPLPGHADHPIEVRPHQI